ncbi:MAG: glycosyltransferase [Acidobacteria bacterium]|jgi:dolichol-phosphate mannosyltransferase|nr:glycosyltransferase [Acidobacteriota bacterium]HJN45987.1 glycosyltransferase family 2 protein [Vicinamibacterales bacterium]|tara:strand:+ start:957 stop:1955 length:999 start_codon:yes stop_codon:yes gene_type:complete
MPEVSIVVPAYNEARNLPLLYDRLKETMEAEHLDWEWIVVDDHSTDESFAVMSSIAARDPRVRAIRLARNYLSHTAITCGLHHCRGACAVVLAADLQDPPELIPKLLEPWRRGVKVVWAARRKRLGERATRVFVSNMFYFVMRRFVGMKGMPARGADFFLVDRQVIEGFRQFSESNVNILGLITWMGFKQETITYDKQARLHGRSAFNLEKNLKLALDAITSFTHVPIRLMSYLGFIVALGGFGFAGWVIMERLTGIDRFPGFATLMVAVLIIGGVQMLMMGVLGEYIWRALDESRRRPRFIIEATTWSEATPPTNPSTPVVGTVSNADTPK